MKRKYILPGSIIHWRREQNGEWIAFLKTDSPKQFFTCVLHEKNCFENAINKLDVLLAAHLRGENL